MTIDNQGKLNLPISILATKVFEQTKKITSIIIDNAVVVEGGFFISTCSLPNTTKQLIKYLKHNK